MTAAHTYFINEPDTFKGGILPLFDRLTGDNASPSHTSSYVPLEKNILSYPSKLLSKKALKTSIISEVKCLLASKHVFTKNVHDFLSHNVMNFGLPGMYGIPFLPTFSTAHSSLLHGFARQLEGIISYFEPRLFMPHVHIQGYNSNSAPLISPSQARLYTIHYAKI